MDRADAAGNKIDDAQRLAWLRLIRSDNVGPATFRDLIARYGNAVAALDTLPELARRVGRRIRICPLEDAERELSALGVRGARLIAMVEPDYPQWLGEIDSAPPLIAVRGDDAIFARPMIAIVGSRNTSVAGKKLAASIARDLSDAGFVVASGLARGIDSAAHEAAIETGTVAVFAGGLDRSTRRKTPTLPSASLPGTARICPRRNSALSRGPVTSRGETGWSRAWRLVSSSTRRRSDRAR